MYFLDLEVKGSMKFNEQNCNSLPKRLKKGKFYHKSKLDIFELFMLFTGYGTAPNTSLRANCSGTRNYSL